MTMNPFHDRCLELDAEVAKLREALDWARTGTKGYPKPDDKAVPPHLVEVIKASDDRIRNL